MTLKHTAFFAFALLGACGPECGDETTPGVDFPPCADDFAVAGGDSCDNTVDEECQDIGGDAYRCVDGQWLVTIHAPLEDCG
jgi:hypothetical protein